MTDERVDLIITDGIATTIAPKLREIVASATEAHTQLRLMQAAVNAIRDSSVKALAKEQTVLSQELSKQGVAHERLAAAAVRTETANARLLLVTGKVNTELERSALVQARVATETLRGEATMQRMTQATEKATDASRRRAAAVGAEGDAAVAAYRKQELAYFNAAQAANVQGGVRQFAGMDNLSGKSARSSASVFLEDAQAKEAAAKATEDLAVRSERLRSAVDPLYAAQVRYDRELTEATMLLRAGTISEETHAKAVMASAGALDAATIASKRHAAQTGLTKFQVLTLQYTINDVVASLASGASPMTILMQQGGQVTQAWGGLIPTLKAAGGALFSVYGAVGAGAIGVGALALAYMKGAAEGENFTRSLILTGNAAGMTALQLGETSRVVAERLKTTVSASAAAMNAMVSSGKIPAEQFEMVAAAALRMEKTTGIAVADTVKQFVELGKDPVKASIALNEQTHFLTAAVWEQIKSLESQGRMSEAGAIAQKAWADAIEQRTPAMLASLGSLERGYAKLMSVIKGVASAALEIGRPDTGEADRIRNMIATKEAGLAADKGYRESSGGKIIQGEVDALKQRLSFLQETERMNARSVEQGVEKTKQAEAQIAFEQLTEKHLQKEQKLRDGIALAQERLAAAQKGASPEQQAANLEKYTQAVKDLQEAYKPKEVAKVKAEKLDPYAQLINELKQAEQLAEREQELSAKSAQSDKVRLSSLYRVVDLYNLKKISVQQLLSAEELIEEVYQKQSGAEKSIAVGKEAVKVHNEYINSLKSSAKAIEDKEVALRDEVKAYDISIAKNISLAEAVDLVAISRLEEARVIQMTYGNEEAVVQIEREIAARKKLSDGIWQQDAHKKQVQSANDVKVEWKKTATSITGSLVDSFTQATDDGTTRFAKMRNDVEQMFKRMALNFVINAAVNTAGRTLGVAGSGGGAGTGATGASSIFSALKGGYEEATGGSAWMTDFGGGVTSEMSKLGNMLSQSSNATVGEFGKDIISFANTPNLAENLTAVGKGLGYLNSAVLLSEGKYGSAAGSAIGTAFGGPIGGMLGQKIGSLLDNTQKSTETTGDANVSFGAGGEVTGRKTAADYFWGGSMTQAADAFVVGLNKTYLEAAQKIGAKTVESYFSYSANTGAQGENPQFAIRSSAGAQTFSSGEITTSEAAMSLAASRAVFNALQKSELPKYLVGVFDDVTASAATQEQLDALMTRAQAMKAFHDQLQLLPFEALKDLSYSAAVALEKAAGGLDKLGGGLSTYYDKFYSTDEKTALLLKRTQESFTALNKTMPALDEATRANYRSMVEELAAKDLSIQANADAYVGVLALAGAVDQLAPTLIDAAKAAEDAAKAAIDAARASAKARLEMMTVGASDAMAALERATAAQKAIDTAEYEASKAAAAAIFAAQTAAIETQLDSVKTSLDAVTNSVGNLKRLSTELQSTLDRMHIIGSESQYRTQAQSAISGALARARSGGGLPVEGELTSALATVSKPSEALFATFTDYARDFYKTAGDIAELNALTEGQLTNEERMRGILQTQNQTLLDQKALLRSGFADQVSTLDAILANAQLQLDAANGLDVSILSIADALKQFNAAILKLTEERALQDLPTSRGVTYTPEQIIEAVKATIASGASVADTYAAAAKNYGVGASTVTAATSGKDLVGFESGTAAADKYSQDQIAEWLRQTVAAGWSMADIYAHALSDYGVGGAVLSKAGKQAGIPGFAIGTSYVPYDMTANIHAGEEITPRPYVDAQREARDETNALLRRLCEVTAKSEQDMAKMREDMEALRSTNKRLSDLAERNEAIGLPKTRTT